MFGFGKKEKINKVFSLLNQDQHFSNTKAEDYFHREDVEKIYRLSSDVNTTVALALLLQQSIFAQRMEEQAPYDDIAKELVDIAREKEADAKTMVEQEADDYVESAKQYGVILSNKLESGKIVSNLDVREFCVKQAQTMLTRWMRYRIKLISAFEAINRGRP